MWKDSQEGKGLYAVGKREVAVEAPEPVPTFSAGEKTSESRSFIIAKLSKKALQL